MKKIIDGFFTIWKDPVWSKVISAAIIGAAIVIWAKISNYSWLQIYYFILKGLSYQIPIWLFLSVIGLYFIIKLCIALFRKRKNPLLDEQMGNYTFKELYNILLTETLPVPTIGMEMAGTQAPTDNLLILFRLNYLYLNTGVSFEDHIGDGGYLHGVLAPKLIGYGLVEAYQKPMNDLPERTHVAYKTSEIGHKFYASLEKLILPEKEKEANQKIKDKK
jgi:hypothetical protein